MMDSFAVSLVYVFISSICCVQSQNMLEDGTADQNGKAKIRIFLNNKMFSTLYRTYFLDVIDPDDIPNN